ncbi:MAG: LamG domain-containing protein [Nanoarchaeota archaeon]|nr:LamG domain-containing protein [Nanoarchaeota archaeon]
MINTQLNISGIVIPDFYNLRVKKTISESNPSSNFQVNVENIAGRHSGDFTIGDEIKIFSDNQELSLISHYKMNDNLATTVVIDDGVGNNNGTLNGGENTSDKSITGKINNAFLLNGTDDFIDIDDVLTNDLSKTTVGTWVVWVRPVDATPTAAENLFNFGDTDGNEVMNLQITSASLLLAFTRDEGVNQWILDTDNAVFSDNVWTHVALVQDGTEPILYIDGVAVAQTFSSSTDKTKWFNDIEGLDNGRIGARNFNNGGNTQHFNGRIDDVRIYNTALTSAQITDIYNNGNGTEENQIIFTGILENIDFKGKETKERINITGRDFTSRLQDRTVEPEVYSNLPAGSIVKDIINKYTDDITVINVDDSPTTIERISFNHTPVYDAVKELADLATYNFYVDVNKDLRFKEKSTTSSNLTFDSGNVLNSSFKEERDSVFNEIWVYGDRYLDNFQESFTGDGVGSVFTLIYKPHNTEITDDGEIQKGGVFGMGVVTSGVNYLVNFFDRQIVFISGTEIGYNDIPGNGSVVVVKYDRSLPIVKVGTNQTSIDIYGKRVKKITDREIKDPVTATKLVTTKLNELSIPKKQGKLKVKNVIDVTPGETCIVNLPWEDVNNQTYDIIEAIYDFNKPSNLSESVLTVTVNKKIFDVTDRLKEFDQRLRKIEAQDVDPLDIITRLEFTTGSMGLRTSGIFVSTATVTGSVSHLYDTNFTPSVNPFNLASGTDQGLLAGSFTGSASAFSAFSIKFSGGFV